MSMEHHPAAPRLLLAIEALAVNAGPIRARVENAWQPMEPLREDEFAEGSEVDLFCVIRERMTATQRADHAVDEMRALFVAGEIFKLFEMTLAPEPQ
jgi:hypothetical protein